MSIKGNKTGLVTDRGIYELKPQTQDLFAAKGSTFLLLIYISIGHVKSQANGAFLKGWHQSCGSVCHMLRTLLLARKG